MSLWHRVYLERRAVLLPLMVLIVVNVGLLALAVLPLRQNVSGLQNDAQNATISLSRARLIEQQAKDARGSKERADQELKKFYADILPANATAARKVFSFLEHAASESGLTFENSHLEESDIKDSQLERMGSKVSLSGDYQNIRKFLYRVETAQEFVVIEGVGLAQAADIRSGNSGRLEVVLDVATYYLAGSPSVPSK